VFSNYEYSLLKSAGRLILSEAFRLWGLLNHTVKL